MAALVVPACAARARGAQRAARAARRLGCAARAGVRGQARRGARAGGGAVAAVAACASRGAGGRGLLSGARRSRPARWPGRGGDVVPLHPRPWALGSSTARPGTPRWSTTASIARAARRARQAAPRRASHGCTRSRTAASGAERAARSAREQAAAAAGPGAARAVAAPVGRRPPGHLVRRRGGGRARRARRALALGAHRRLGPPRPGGLAAMALWLVAGLALCSVCRTCGHATSARRPGGRGLPGRRHRVAVGAPGWRPGRRGGPRRLSSSPLASVSVGAVRRGAQDSKATGALPAGARRGPRRATSRRDSGPDGSPSAPGARSRRWSRATTAPCSCSPTGAAASSSRRAGWRATWQRRVRYALLGTPARRAAATTAPAAFRSCVGSRARRRRQPRRGTSRGGALYVLTRGVRRQPAEERPRPPRRGERRRRRRDAIPPGQPWRRRRAARARRGLRRAAGPLDLARAGLAGAATPCPGRRRSAAIARASGRRSRRRRGLAAVGHDVVGGAVDLEDGQRALRVCTAAASCIRRRRPRCPPAAR